MQDQLELRDSQIGELKRLYRDSRDAEARSADVVQQLRVQLARHEQCTTNAGMIAADADIHGTIQQEKRELRDRVAQLESQLRLVLPSCN